MSEMSPMDAAKLSRDITRAAVGNTPAWWFGGPFKLPKAQEPRDPLFLTALWKDPN